MAAAHHAIVISSEARSQPSENLDIGLQQLATAIFGVFREQALSNATKLEFLRGCSLQ